MVDFERFKKLNNLCDKSRLPISSVEEIQKIGGEIQNIISNPGTKPFDDTEKVLVSIIEENIFLRLIDYATKVDTENIKLSDEELEFIEEKYEEWEEAIGWMDKSTKELEESSSDLLREAAVNRKKK